MNRLIAIATMAMAAVLSGNAQAHGAQARHGGIVQDANDLHFELVNKGGKAAIYVEDHGAPLPTAGATGKLTVLNGTEKTEVSLEPGGDNVLVARGDAKLAKGSKAIAAVTLADRKTINVRFAVK